MKRIMLLSLCILSSGLQAINITFRNDTRGERSHPGYTIKVISEPDFTKYPKWFNTSLLSKRGCSDSYITVKAGGQQGTITINPPCKPNSFIIASSANEGDPNYEVYYRSGPMSFREDMIYNITYINAKAASDGNRRAIKVYPQKVVKRK